MIASGNPWKIVFFTSHFKTLNASSWNNLFELRKDESSRNFDHLNEWSPERDCRSLPFWQAEREPFSFTLSDARLWNQWGLLVHTYMTAILGSVLVHHLAWQSWNWEHVLLWWSNSSVYMLYRTECARHQKSDAVLLCTGFHPLLSQGCPSTHPVGHYHPSPMSKSGYLKEQRHKSIESELGLFVKHKMSLCEYCGDISGED